MGTVIKFGEATRILDRLTTVDLADHLAEARAVLDRARAQAEQIVQGARNEELHIRQEAQRRGTEVGLSKGYEKGYADGESAGREAGQRSAHDAAMRRYDEQCAGLVANFSRLVDEFDSRKEELLVSTERSLLEFSVKLASKLTFAVGALHRDAALANVDRAVRLVGLSTDLTVRVHPDDLTAIDAFAKDVLAHAEKSKAVKIVADDSFAPGGCKLQTDVVEIDATLETQVNEIVDILLGRRTVDV